MSRSHTVALVAVSLGALVVAQTGGAVRAASAGGPALPPTCPAKDNPGAEPAPNCIFKPWGYSGAAPIHGSGKLTHVRKVGNGLYYEFTVVLRYKNPFKDCASTTTGRAPCQQLPNVVRVVGRYMPGAPTLADAMIGASTPATCPDAGPTCTLTYKIFSTEDFGRIVLVFSYEVTDLTTNPSNDLGTAGFEFPVVMNIPKFKGTP